MTSDRLSCANVSSDTPSLRIDKWLWHARLFKSRSAAQRFVEAGNVRINSQKIRNSAKPVRISDVLTLAFTPAPGPGFDNEYAPKIRILRILDCATKRGSNKKAKMLYRELDLQNRDKTEKTTPEAEF